jgi:acyl-CoA synthetase (AMP-forming)/AMP-acid ligase II
MLAIDGDRPAVIMAGSGARRSYRELVEGANKMAHWFRVLGLEPGASIAFCLENHPRFFDILWAAHDAGLYFTAISSRLKTEEIAYIANDCGARVLISSKALAAQVAGVPALVRHPCHAYVLDGSIDGFAPLDPVLAGMPATPVADLGQGLSMAYSSGTTGFPKGIKPPRADLRFDQPAPLIAKLRELYGFDVSTAYLSPAPLYHAAPLKFNWAVQASGGTSVIMEKFDPEYALACIEKYRVTHSQWVPTMFSRMLKMPPEIRNHYDLSTHRLAIHAAAPCPMDVKEKMLAWWGPIIHEYYSGSESIGMCVISPEEWLAHKGSVGRPARGIPHIVGDDGEELPRGKVGYIFFETDTVLRYHNDPVKTADAHNAKGWATIGDIGYLDSDGYLYLTDRKDFMIISGGVNIYPQEAENLLSSHPKVADVAVIGVPDDDLGEEVKAVVVATPGVSTGPALERELIDYCRASLAHLKCPKTVDFVSELPREPTGKLLKKIVRAQYWPAQ